MPVHLHLRGFPAPLVAQFYRRVLKWVGDEAVLSVYGMREVRQLRARSSKLRVVFLFEERLFERIAWLLETRSQNGDNPSPAPVVFLHSNSHISSDAPGPALVVHGTSPQQGALHDWISRENSLPGLQVPDAPLQVTLSAQLEGLFSPETRQHSLGIREKQILRGLLAGSALLREPDIANAEVKVSLDDYRNVLPVLQSVATQPSGEPFDPLALAMVQRANA